MFTGIVEEKGQIVGLHKLNDSAQLLVRGRKVTSGVVLGDSIAVNGCCLTVTALGGDGEFAADVMPETLSRTNLGRLDAGDPVNLERAMKADGRFGGHIVQGHVDATGILLERTSAARWDVLMFSIPSDLSRYIVEKGSITVNGVSLTVVDVSDGDPATFTVSLIPTTLEDTNLGTLEIGDPVNLETDVLAKHLERLAEFSAERGTR